MSITKIIKGRYAGGFRVRIQPKDITTGKQISLPSKVVGTFLEAKNLKERCGLNLKKIVLYLIVKVV
ncbi:hypothetical protein [Lactobacillus sp. ESL0681]|uniref:hypothetical protein n=1 Tax=Lactobacillus sp. ESL0681 TaxID=2983211 RepID=UPI0023F647F8|nr:hypothetical protein [Lactobacillus sp. ESL0681]WEV39784.1 hypothetical protein OZX59_06125 [Lactobacillus sp. ESL0681]